MQDLAQMATRIRRARVVPGLRVELVSQLDCWRTNALRDGAVLAQGGEATRAAGAERVAIDRADTMQALGLWEQI